ncbi:acetyl-CoA C-acyltransferase [Plasticicumulans sp.]|uniref:acetyl-CoA C-acyltransferase n=1 Tax=Plasticicumulans sp. TaxID=2307179 RepID=UPI002BE9A33E|nr:acetyl-CoA C-acyltransferase [Plasticicumulans sp.]HNM42048.1 acetyl-CoA C-acyltransferase [Plasticicumulans sp.]
MKDPVVIVGQARTALGEFRGALSALSAPALGAVAIRAAVTRAGVDAQAIDAVFMGCVLSAGLGQAPARQAAIAAGLPWSVPCTTVNKVCGSGMQAVMLAHDGLLAGSLQRAVAGGMESMSNAPYLLPKARTGLQLGHGQLLDHLFTDGLEDPFEPGRRMGEYAEDCAAAIGCPREDQDAWALESLRRARAAIDEGAFAGEISGCAVPERGGGTWVDVDQHPLHARAERIARLPPVFRADGSVTAGNASAIADGAAALVLMRASAAANLGLPVLARIRGHATQAQRGWTDAPAAAVRKLCAAIGWRIADVDLWEINEAFAVIAIAALRELGLAHAQVNVHGGACALGHPIGCSGARLLVTLIAALQRHGLRRGIATLCIGGGEATAVAVERG